MQLPSWDTGLLYSDLWFMLRRLKVMPMCHRGLYSRAGDAVEYTPLS